MKGPMPVPKISELDFEQEVLRSELPVLVQFTATWCGPCKTVAPEVEAIAVELEGKARVIKVDIDESKRLAQGLRIQAVPAFMIFQGGRPVAAEQGVLRRAQLRAMLEPFLPRAEGAIRAVELAELIKQRQVVPVDIREAGPFGRAHIPTAVSLPQDEIEGRLAELHMLAGEPVLYCRSGDKAKELAEKLTQGGMPMAFLEGGFLAWEAELFPVERPD